MGHQEFKIGTAFQIKNAGEHRLPSSLDLKLMRVDRLWILNLHNKCKTSSTLNFDNGKRQ